MHTPMHACTCAHTSTLIPRLLFTGNRELSLEFQHVTHTHIIMCTCTCITTCTVYTHTHSKSDHTHSKSDHTHSKSDHTHLASFQPVIHDHWSQKWDRECLSALICKERQVDHYQEPSVCTNILVAANIVRHTPTDRNVQIAYNTKHDISKRSLTLTELCNSGVHLAHCVFPWNKQGGGVTLMWLAAL